MRSRPAPGRRASWSPWRLACTCRCNTCVRGDSLNDPVFAGGLLVHAQLEVQHFDRAAQQRFDQLDGRREVAFAQSVHAFAAQDVVFLRSREA